MNNLIKKIGFATLLNILTCMSVSAQGAAPLAEGEMQFNFGFSLHGGGLPIYGGMDYAVHPDVTVGAEMGLNLDGFDYLTVKGYGDYHFNTLLGIPPEWDFYAGSKLGLGTDFYDGGTTSGFVYDVHVGGRWYWNKKWGLNLEFAGSSTVSGRMGVSMKL